MSCLQIQLFLSLVLQELKDADGMAKSLNRDQTAPCQEQSDLGLQCLLKHN